MKKIIIASTLVHSMMVIGYLYYRSTKKCSKPTIKEEEEEIFMDSVEQTEDETEDIKTFLFEKKQELDSMQDKIEQIKYNLGDLQNILSDHVGTS